jgi:Transposase DDE domain
VVSIDGTRIAGSANPDVNLAFDQIALEIVAQTRATDEAEDQKFGEARGDELPEELRTPEGRREFLRRARQAVRRDEEGERPDQIEESDAEPETEESDAEPDAEAETEEPERAPTPEFEFDAERITDAGGGRRRWLSEAKRQLEQHRWENPDPIVRSRVGRLLLALGRLEADLSAERAGNEAYEAYRRQGRMRDGRRFGRPADPYQPPEVPEGKVNVTDPDSRPIPVGFGFVQGYNGQTAVNENQIVLAAEITNLSTDFSQLSPMVNATLQELRRAGIADVGRLLEAVAADAGYWNEQQMDDVINNQHIRVLVAPDKGSRATPKRWLTDGRANWMRTVLKSDDGHRRYAKRKQTVEPLYGDTKHNRGFIRFHRRGRVKVRTEFRLLMMTHNLTKAYRHQIATMAA